MSRLRNGFFLAAMVTLLASGCGEAMPAAMFIAENPPSKPGQKPVEGTDSVRSVPFGVVLENSEAESAPVADSLCPKCNEPLKSNIGICFVDIGSGEGSKDICAREFTDLSPNLDPQNSGQLPRCRDHDNDDPTAGLLRDGVIPSLVQNWCRVCKIQYENEFRGRCPHCSKPVSLLSNACLNAECSGKTTRGKSEDGPKFAGFYAIVTGDTSLVIENGTTVFCPQEGCGEEISPEEGFCQNAKTPHRYRLYAKSVPCSRCGGSKLCPECSGSGLSRTAEPIRPCWFCTKTKSSGKGPGVCPQCDEDGFETLGDSR